MTYNVTDTQIVLIVMLVVWEMVWKGLALWRSAKLGQKGWFVAILILNTAGILPIIYLIASASKVKNTVGAKL